MSPTRAPSRPRARGPGIRHAADDTWSDMLSRVLVEKVEPNLGQGRMTILDRYPAAEAALARRAPDDPRAAERFELYACGVELANGFGELTDPAEQRRRFASGDGRKAARLRRALSDGRGLSRRPSSSCRPPAGMALGFDRLVMLATGAPRIDDVMWAPVADLSAQT